MAKEKEEKKPKVEWKKPDTRAEVEKLLMKNLEGFCTHGARVKNVGWFPTNHFNLDFAIQYGTLPINVNLDNYKEFDPKEPGGIPKGRIIEVFGEPSGGKSSVCFRIVGAAQKRKKVCLWMDREHSFVESLAELNGVDIDDLNMMDKPGVSAEECFDLMYLALESGVDLIVVDSVSGLIPKAILDGVDSTKDTMALQARIMGKCIPKLASVAAKTGGTVIFINQLRMKPGVLYGCFHADTLVSFADGSRISISEVVDKKLKGPVLSFNPETQQIESAEITGWHNNGLLGNDEKWLHILCEGPGTKNGRLGFNCTRNHVLFMADGCEVAAEDIVEGDTLLTYRESKILQDDVHRDIIYGSLLGDGHIALRAENTACFRLANSDSNQKGYVAWKMRNLPMLNFNHIMSCGRDRWDSEYSVEMRTLKDEFYINDTGYRMIPEDLMLTDLMVAVWYQDDGNLKSDGRLHETASISIKRLSSISEQTDRAIRLLEKWEPKLLNHVQYSISTKTVVFDTKGSEILFERITPYIHSDMRYKLPTEYAEKSGRGLFSLKPTQKTPMLVPYSSKVLRIRDGSDRANRNKCKYDLTINGNASYLVGGGTGIVVHNSPETTPGGETLKFYSSLRIQITKRYGEDAETYRTDENGQQILIAQDSYAYIRKNRFSKNLRNGIPIPIYFEAFFPDAEERAFDLGRQTKLISTREGNYTWKYGDGKTERIDGKGRQGFINAIIEANKVTDLIEAIKTVGAEQGVILPPELMLYKPDGKKKVVKKAVEQTAASKIINEFLEQDALSSQEADDLLVTSDQAKVEAEAILGDGPHIPKVEDASETSRRGKKKAG